jgi:hypothetical protein
MRGGETERQDGRGTVLVGEQRDGWGVSPLRRRERTLFEGWGPTL